MPFVVSSGRPIYYERRGQGPAILFCHGAGSNSATWWQQLPAFGARHTCITVDIRCFGRSAAPLAEFEWPNLVQDMVKVLDQEAVERVAVVGQSLGGMIGLRLALEHAQRIAALVACDTSLSIDHPGMLERIRQRQTTHKAVTIEQRSLGAWFLSHEPAKAELYAQINHFNPSAHTLSSAEWGEALAALMRSDVLLPMDAMRNVRCPTLFLVGSEDPIVPVASTYEIAELVTDSEVAVIQDAGHSAYFEKPSEFNEVVLDFIARCVHF